jgi:hypothetical protein
MACETHEFQSYNDYPQEATDSACRVLKWIDEHGRDEVQGMTQTGLARANQLCNREPISEDTIARMAAFERHRENSKISPEFKGTPWKDKGYVSWLGWGNDAGIAWAQKKLKEIRNEMGLEDACWEGYEPIGLKDDGSPNCVPKKMAAEGELNVFGYNTKNFHICPGAIGTFTNLINTKNLHPDSVGMIRSAAVIADKVFELEKKVIQDKKSTPEILKEAVVLVDDFKDVIDEISKDTKVKYDVSYMDGHIKVISDYLTEDMDYDVSGLPSYSNQTGKSGKTISDNSFLQHEFSYDEEKMEITGAAIIPNKMIIRRNPITEELYYVFFSTQTTKILSEKFMSSGKTWGVNLNHQDVMAPETYVTESWIVTDKNNDKSAALGLDFPEGTWCVTMKVGSDELWEQIKNGTYSGFSIEGWFNERMVFN